MSLIPYNFDEVFNLGKMNFQAKKPISFQNQNHPNL